MQEHHELLGSVRGRDHVIGGEVHSDDLALVSLDVQYST